MSKANGFFKIGLVLLAAALSAALAQDRTFVTIATGGTGGVYYVYGGGLASLLGEWLPGVEATAEATAASVDNIKLVGAGRADLAFSLADTAADGFNGGGDFEAPIPVRAVAVLYTNYTHIVTLEGSGIETVADLSGKRVSTGAAGSGTEVIALRILEAAGLSEADITQDRLGASESAAALRDRRIDAFFWSGGLPTAAVLDLANSPGLTLKLLGSSDLVETLQSNYGAQYFTSEIPADAYSTAEPVSVVAVANVLVTSAEADPELIYQITQAMFEHQEQLAAIHPEAAKLNVDSAVSGSPIPFHEGAARYYQEQGKTVATE